jgi:hypothetical protein
MEDVPVVPMQPLVEGGLRNFDDMVGYLRNPVVLEMLFLVMVATHAMLGVRSIVLDLGVCDRVERPTGRPSRGDQGPCGGGTFGHTRAPPPAEMLLPSEVRRRRRTPQPLPSVSLPRRGRPSGRPPSPSLAGPAAAGPATPLPDLGLVVPRVRGPVVRGSAGAAAPSLSEG